MKVTGEPLKRVPVEVVTDADPTHPLASFTDRLGTARFESLDACSGKIRVDGITRHHGYLDGAINIELWSLLANEAGESGTPGGHNAGSTAYPGMQTRAVTVDGREVMTDSEGYLVNLEDWSEDFARAQAAVEELALDAEHWMVIRYLREYFESHGRQAAVRDIIKHFRRVWGPEKGSNNYLHTIFPRGGPQKQGNRLAGLLRTKGEH
jgi:tRNA 2-thiouridine synthesizing protein E